MKKDFIPVWSARMFGMKLWQQNLDAFYVYRKNKQAPPQKKKQRNKK